MGWWRIDPETGMPAEAPSRLSQPPDFVLLNAVPGADDDAEAHYLGDGPWDMAADTARQIEAVLGPARQLSEDEVRRLLLERQLPPGVEGMGPGAADRLLRIADELWRDIDTCYEDDWGRPARPAERRWVCEYAIASLNREED
jgi:hypothetical protein